MAITDENGLLAGMQPPLEFYKSGSGLTMVVGRWHSSFYLAGIPGAAVAPTPGVGGVALTTYDGQLPFTNPVSGNTHLARYYASSNVIGSLLLVDRLWHNSGLSPTLTTPQNVNSAAWPTRSSDGTINGSSVLIGVEVTGATGIGTPTFTMSYTNQAGVAGRTGTGLTLASSSSHIGAFYWMGLQAGDTGVRSIQNFTLSATWTSGTFSLVAFRVLARLSLPTPNIAASIDAVTGGMPRMYDNTVPFQLFLPQSTTGYNPQGHLIYSQG